MGFGNHFLTSPKMCFSTEDFIEWMNEHYHKSVVDDDEKIIPKWFYLPYCDECER